MLSATHTVPRADGQEPRVGKFDTVDPVLGMVLGKLIAHILLYPKGILPEQIERQNSLLHIDQWYF